MTWLTALAQRLPTALTLAVLLGIGWWGHQHGWTLGHEPAVVDPHAEDWCAEHAVHESACLLCRKSLLREQRAREPAAHALPGEELNFAQVASAEAAARFGITTGVAAGRTWAPAFTVPAETMPAPHHLARVTARVFGAVRAVKVTVGQQVTAGEIIAVIESPDLGRLEAELMHAVVERLAAATEAERMRTLAAGGYRAASDARSAETRLQTAEVAEFAAEQALQGLGLAVSASALAQLAPAAMPGYLRALRGIEAGSAPTANQLAIRAPLAGIISECPVVLGQTLAAGDLVGVIVDPSRLWLRLALTAPQVAQVAVGQAVTLATEQQSVEGVITMIGAIADEHTRLTPVFAELPNPQRMVRINQVGQATIVVGKPAVYAVVPPSAVQYAGSTAYVFLPRTPLIFRGLPVSVLTTVSEGVIIDRVQPGDALAISGTAVLKGNLFQDQFGPGCACGAD